MFLRHSLQPYIRKGEQNTADAQAGGVRAHDTRQDTETMAAVLENTCERVAHWRDEREENRGSTNSRYV